MAKSTTHTAGRNTGRSRGSPVFTGVMIGLIFGAVLAVAVALWTTGTNPFRAATDAPSTPQAQGKVDTPAAPETAPSFDFYKVLPSDTPSEMPAPPPPRPQPTPVYYLQAGAFQNAADADNLKAQLALLGIETVIQTRDLGEKGVFHRVRVGPFGALDDINRTRALLAQNSISTTLVKDEPTSQETP